MSKSMFVPRVNTNDNEVEIVHWFVEDKQFVEQGQEIVEVESSKAVVSIESEASGYILTQGKVGEIVKVGAPLAVFYPDLAQLEAALQSETATQPDQVPLDQGAVAAEDDRSKTARTAATAIAEPPQNNTKLHSNIPFSHAEARILRNGEAKIDQGKEEQNNIPSINATSYKPTFDFTRFSAAAKAYIEQNKLDASRFEGIGLVTVDVIETVLGLKPQSQPQPQPQPQPPQPTSTTATPPDNNLRSEKVSKSKQIEISLLTAGQAGGINSSLTVQFESAAIRQTLATTGSLSGQILPLILFEFSRLLEEYPVFNAYYHEGRIYYYDAIDIGLAIDLGKGLKVPVLRQANHLSPVEILEAVTTYATQYLDNQLDPANLIGSTVTVSDLSSENILHFQPLINKNQAIILGIGGDRNMAGHPMTLTVVFDHRLAAGREVALFLNQLKSRLLSYAITNLPQTAKAHKTQDVQCSKCLIDLNSLYQKFGQEALMHVYLNQEGEKDYICHVCMGGF